MTISRRPAERNWSPPVAAGEYRFAVGTAGSTTLVLQTVLPALLTASGPSRLVLEGGTHNPQAPPYPFLADTFLPLINRMGPEVTATLERPGFYPAGGGRLRVDVKPCERLRGFEVHERGDTTQIELIRRFVDVRIDVDRPANHRAVVRIG